MILVCGTKRSGTSLWMQMLEAAGYSIIGEAFPSVWEESIREANPRGFFESRLRQGVFFATNPDPESGEFIFPDSSKNHAVKVFVPGLVRTDYAFIDRVVGTMRHWSAYSTSLSRLYEIEDRYLEQQDGEDRLEKARALRSPLPAPVEWWFENFEMIRDAATRKYALNLCTYERLIEDPAPILERVFEWLGGGDVDAALGAIEPSLRTQGRPEVDGEGLDAAHLEVMETLHDHVHRGAALPASFLGRMNEMQEEMVEAWGSLSRDRARETMTESES